MWVLLAVLSALLLGFYEVTKKVALNGNAVLPVLFLNVIISALIFLPFSIVSAATGWLDGTPFHVPAITLTAHGAIFLKAVIVLSSWISGYFAVKNLPLIITSSIKATQPAFILIGAILLFSERLNGYQWAGTLLAMIALILFSSVGKREGIVFEKNKWIYLIFLATLLGALSSLWDKHLVTTFDKAAVQVYTAYYQTFLMIPVLMVLWYPHRKHSTPFRWRNSILYISLFLTVSDFLYFYSLSLDGSLISVVSTIRKGGVIVPFVAGAVLFHERHILVKAVLLGFVLIGMYLIFLGS